MSRILVNTKEMPREDWLDYRRTSLGGSDASVILGLNDFKSKYTLWAEKKGFVNNDSEDNERMRIGRDLEQYVAERFCEATGKKVRRRNYMFLHDDYDFISANVDREIIGENAGLECKTTSAFSKSDFENGEIPLYYYCQCMHYMAVMGYEKMYLAVLVLGKSFHWFEIERNEKEIESLINTEVNFWNRYVLSDVEVPEVDGSENTFKTISQMYPKAENEEMIDLDNEDVCEYIKLQEQIKKLQSYADEFKQKIQVSLGKNSFGKTKGFEVSYKNQSRTTVDSKRLKEEQPEIYKEYSKESSTRVLRVKKLKEAI
ncbi:MAG: YqaJ viral recombinase family protein [Clostridia bacterium]|nr:YqaJ viral recombinase family protein [Clostridia bacterium]